MNKNRKIVLDTLNEQNIEYEMFEHQAVYTVDPLAVPVIKPPKSFIVQSQIKIQKLKL